MSAANSKSCSGLQFQNISVVNSKGDKPYITKGTLRINPMFHCRAKNSFSYCGAILWNSLPCDLGTLNSYSKEKNKTRGHSWKTTSYLINFIIFHVSYNRRQKFTTDDLYPIKLKSKSNFEVLEVVKYMKCYLSETCHHLSMSKQTQSRQNYLRDIAY